MFQRSQIDVNMKIGLYEYHIENVSLSDFLKWHNLKVDMKFQTDIVNDGKDGMLQRPLNVKFRYC